MKNILKCIVPVSMIFLMLFCLVGCSGGISGDEAKAHINGFFDAVEAADYEQAATFLHPDKPADLKSFFENLETDAGLDFSAIEITKYTGFSSSYYDSNVKGSSYRLFMRVNVSDREVKMEIEIVRNDAGYGIYDLDIDT